MRLKRFGLRLVAVAMLAAIVAGSASGAATTPTETHWIIAGTKLATGGSETVSCSVGKHLFNESGQSGLREAKLQLKGSIGAAKTPVTLTATGIECINTAGTGANGTATINQTATMAEGEGRIRFSGVTFDEPPNCQVKGISVADPVGTVTTVPLKSQVQQETVGEVTTTFEKVEPKAGGVVVEIAIERKSAELGCGLSGNYAIKGTAFGEGVKNVEGTEGASTGFETVTQALTHSAAIEATAGGNLTLGGNPVSITGRVLSKLTSGKQWGAVK